METFSSARAPYCSLFLGSYSRHSSVTSMILFVLLCSMLCINTSMIQLEGEYERIWPIKSILGPSARPMLWALASSCLFVYLRLPVYTHAHVKMHDGRTGFLHQSCQEIYGEIEEIGWDNLIHLKEDLSIVSFRVRDENERVHAVEIRLPPNYPNSAPSLAADMPYQCELHWQRGFRLKDSIQQFIKHLEKIQDFWSVLEEVDRNLCVLEPKHESRAASFRLIRVDLECQILLHIDGKNPRAKPECRFLGPDLRTDDLRKSWKKNSRKWKHEDPFTENIRTLLGVDMACPVRVPMNAAEKEECGICYVHFLPSEIVKEDSDSGSLTGTAVDYKCENPSCKKSFHSICLRDWLKSITTTKQSFDVLFGKCPYCSEPVAVKLEGSE